MSRKGLTVLARSKERDDVASLGEEMPSTATNRCAQSDGRLISVAEIGLRPPRAHCAEDVQTKREDLACTPCRAR